jgi:HSP20 family protein|tara:strand:- start:41 stop:484 length:444 start_codon:yes stop_codon:yes gene_type:complete
MSQLIYSPFTALNQLHRELGRVFDDSATFSTDDNPLGRNAWVPQVDISEDEHRFLVTADLPGVNPKAVDVTVDGNILTIRGERATDSSASGAGYKRRERISGAFIRQFALPETVDGKSITARAANGVLEIKVPKGERHQPVNITVES